MSNNTNKALIRRFFNEVFNQQSEAAAAEIISADFVAHHPAFPEGIRGPEGIMQMVGMFRSGFPDLRYQVEALVAEEDMVAVRWSARGTHQGTFMQVPSTGKTVTVIGLDMFRTEGDQLTEAWVNSDFLGLLQQIGAVPSPEVSESTPE